MQHNKRNVPPYFVRKISKVGSIKRLPRNLQGYYSLIIPLNIKTEKTTKLFRQRCKHRTEYCQFTLLGKRCHWYTNGLTEHIKPMIPLIKEKILNNCIKNPRKYLEEVK